VEQVAQGDPYILQKRGIMGFSPTGYLMYRLPYPNNTRDIRQLGNGTTKCFQVGILRRVFWHKFAFNRPIVPVGLQPYLKYHIIPNFQPHNNLPTMISNQRHYRYRSRALKFRIKKIALNYMHGLFLNHHYRSGLISKSQEPPSPIFI